jgi:MYXO-CTERM domain-containing protein
VSHPRLLVVAALLPAGCKAPPEAPEELDELAGYIFARHADEDPAAEQAGLTRLTEWLDLNWGEAEDGYEITGLDEATVDSLDEVDRATEGMLGLAVPTESVHTVDEAAYAMLAVSESEVYPDMFVEYEREVFGDLDCFLDHACDRVEARENMESHFPLDVVSISQAYNQYLWVDLGAGPAMVQRNWIEFPPEVTGPLASYIEVDEQFYLNVFLPREEGFWRLQATWMIFSQDGVPEDVAMNLAVNNMVDNSAILDEYLAGLTLDDQGEGGCSSAPGAPGGAALLLALGLAPLRRRRGSGTTLSAPTNPAAWSATCSARSRSPRATTSPAPA